MTKELTEAEHEEQIAHFKLKKIIKQLSQARGNGTSMISLIIRPKDDISRINRLLTDEYGTASNIKSRVNRLSVLSAITSTQQKLKTFSRTPPNGLVIFCGTVLTDDGKEKKINIGFEPYKPINASLYLCDNKFHVEPLNELLDSNDKIGFIVMDGNGSLFGQLQGSRSEVLYKFTIDLPKKHGRGGQSAVRFARLRVEKRHNYVRRVAEVATKLFITNDKPNVVGLVLAGSADFKSELAQSDMFDSRLSSKILKIVDISYGGLNGFYQAIELSRDCLSNLKILHEKALIKSFFEEIATDSGKFVYGSNETLKLLDVGCIETLILWENLEVQRLTLKDNNQQTIFYQFVAHSNNVSTYTDPETNQDYEVVEQESFVEWIVENYKDYGLIVEIITDSSQEGQQFVKGFGGIGAILRYKVDLEPTNDFVNDYDYEDEFL
uniref:Eukaryotic peptide chain release factor subunit 1 n=1 Tax=Dermatophagoides pteronyssinus TaxID=6956 RepID=A0A6P6Y9S7_DERPT|nr:eukaryotic peptide chain release factor subunit 1-like [Dermatophagoides pteronyssinus]